MTDQSQAPPVYSYRKFKELADDRMSQVKIFIQHSDTWEASGSGMLHLFQLTSQNIIKELNHLADFDSNLKNLYALVEASEVQLIPDQELSTLNLHFTLLNSKNLKINNVISFYDFCNGIEFEYDIESSFSRKSHQLDS